MERLSHLIEEAIRTRTWQPVFASKGGPPLSHLFFIDDLILFREAMMEQVLAMKHCVDRFCSSSGQRVSNSKSQYSSARTRATT